jgi:hypothetical protein
MRFGRVLSPSRLSCAGMAARRSLRSGAGPSDAESRCGEPRPSPRPGEGGVSSHRRQRWSRRTSRAHGAPCIRKVRVTPTKACARSERVEHTLPRHEGLARRLRVPHGCSFGCTARARRGSLQPPLRGRGRRRSAATGARPSPRSKRRKGSARSRSTRPYQSRGRAPRTPEATPSRKSEAQLAPNLQQQRRHHLRVYMARAGRHAHPRRVEILIARQTHLHTVRARALERRRAGVGRDEHQ